MIYIYMSLITLLIKVHVRICTNQRKSLCLPSDFSYSIMSTSSMSWLDEKYFPCSDDIFAHDTIFIPYRWNGIRSMFVVVGSNYIQDYRHPAFDRMRPCIIHICPTTRQSRQQASMYKSVCGKIRLWLNVAWRHFKNIRDVTCNPFHNRSIPLVEPNGTEFLNTFYF